MAEVTAYIDGFNLYFGMKNKSGRRYFWLDVVEMMRQLRPNDRIVKVRYFTAIVKGEPAAAGNQYEYLEALNSHNGPILDLHVGWFKERPIRRCGRCGQLYTCVCRRRFHTYEEKGTDVALGAMMVADAAVGLGETTILISADADLAPALDAIRRVVPSNGYSSRCRPATSRRQGIC